MSITEHFQIWRKFVIPRVPRLWELIRARGIFDGWFIWKIENNLILDFSGEFLDHMSRLLRQQATRSRWYNNEEEASGVLEFLGQLEIFHAIYHKNSIDHQ